jgi:hypothetical protein
LTQQFHLRARGALDAIVAKSVFILLKLGIADKSAAIETDIVAEFAPRLFAAGTLAVV